MRQAFPRPEGCDVRMIAMHQVCVPAWAYSHLGEIFARRNNDGMPIAQLLIYTGETWVSHKTQASRRFSPVWR